MSTWVQPIQLLAEETLKPWRFFVVEGTPCALHAAEALTQSGYSDCLSAVIYVYLKSYKI